MLKAILDRHLNLSRFFVGEGPQLPPYLLHRRRVYILPTRQGLIFAFLVFVMLLASVNYNNNLGYMLTFLLTGVMVISIFHTYSNLLALEIGPAMLKPAFAGHTTPVAIQITNHGFTTRCAVECRLPKQPAVTLDVAANSSIFVRLPIKFDRRGLHPLPRFIVATVFPLGLFRAWSHVQLQQSILIYPAPADDPCLPQNTHGDQQGETRTVQGLDDFEGLRNYQPGDSLYRIHWKTAAKHQLLQTKQYVGSAAADLYLRWADTTRQDVETRLSQLTRWVLLADAASRTYGLEIPGHAYPPDSGPAHKHRCLAALALYGSSDDSRT
ncbi:MAG: DUF58 domain-containing protein [Gammaproteobacteria bacterium]|nr:DUF58 domain-containing protein [Gammaproteobacteria bacterium]MDH5650285.1 DUF58 domain-containing protein [Gammaproteobacteria bacterium]